MYRLSYLIPGNPDPNIQYPIGQEPQDELVSTEFSTLVELRAALTPTLLSHLRKEEYTGLGIKNLSTRECLSVVRLIPYVLGHSYPLSPVYAINYQSSLASERQLPLSFKLTKIATLVNPFTANPDPTLNKHSDIIDKETALIGTLFQGNKAIQFNLQIPGIFIDF